MNIRLSSILVVILFVWLLSEAGLNAQMRFAGASVSGVYPLTTKNITGFPDFPIEDIRFNPEKSINFDFNLFAEYNFYRDFYVGAEIGYLQSSLLYKGYEEIKVIIDKKPIDGTVRHVFDVNLNWVYPAVFVGYSYKYFALSVGNKFNFDVSSYYNTTQTIIEPDSMYFINPSAQQSIDIKNVNRPVYMPFIRFTYDLGKQVFKTNAFTTQLDFEYAFAVNSVSSQYDIKTTNIKFGINVGFNFTKSGKNYTMIYDTVYTSDTLVSYSFDIQSEQTKLVTVARDIAKDTSGSTIVYKTEVAQHLIREIPKPRPLLNGELKTVFVTPGGTEMQECIISYSRQLVKKNFLVEKNKKLNFQSESKMKRNVEIPAIRFYTSIIAEDGLDSTIVKLYSGNGKLLKEIIRTGEEQKYIDVKIDSLIDLKDLKPLSYELTLVDMSGQKKTVATGEIILKSKETNMVTSNIIYYFDLNFDEMILSRRIAEIEKNNPYKRITGYYSRGLDSEKKKKVEAFAGKFKKIKFIAATAEELREKFYTPKRQIEQDLIIVIEK